MTNSIDITLSEENPISSLNYLWTSLFSDKTFINQIDDDGTRHRFTEVVDRFNELEKFVLYNKNNINDKYIVDIKRGIIYRNTAIESYDSNKETKNNIRLIYFRRRRKYISEKGTFSNIRYFLGFQYIDCNNKNCKVIIQLDNDGNFIIDGE